MCFDLKLLFTRTVCERDREGEGGRERTSFPYNSNVCVKIIMYLYQTDAIILYDYKSNIHVQMWEFFMYRCRLYNVRVCVRARANKQKTNSNTQTKTQANSLLLYDETFISLNKDIFNATRKFYFASVLYIYLMYYVLKYYILLLMSFIHFK